MKSKLFSLHVRDFVKGLILAVITGVITFLTNELQIGSTIDSNLFRRIGVAAIIAFLSYILKNYFTNSKDEFATKEPNEISKK
jgi:uncharacterized membrane protein YvlD (DUF360 family)